MILDYHTPILTKEERLALNSLRDNTSIIIKEANKGSGVVVWDRKNYLKEAEKQLSDKETYEELSSDLVSPLISIVKGFLSRVKNRDDIPSETLEYFFITNPTHEGFICYLRSTNDCIMSQVDLIVDFLQKTFQFFRVSLKALSRL